MSKPVGSQLLARRELHVELWLDIRSSLSHCLCPRNNSGIEALALNNGISRTNGETIRRSMLFEPGKEQSIAIGLTPVTIVTNIEQYVKMLFKKYVEYGKDSGYQDWWQKQNHHLGRRTPHMVIGY